MMRRVDARWWGGLGLLETRRWCCCVSRRAPGGAAQGEGVECRQDRCISEINARQCATSCLSSFPVTVHSRLFERLKREQKAESSQREFGEEEQEICNGWDGAEDSHYTCTPAVPNGCISMGISAVPGGVAPYRRVVSSLSPWQRRRTSTANSPARQGLGGLAPPWRGEARIEPGIANSHGALQTRGRHEQLLAPNGSMTPLASPAVAGSVLGSSSFSCSCAPISPSGEPGLHLHTSLRGLPRGWLVARHPALSGMALDWLKRQLVP
jgi:hypothetical protein